MLFYLMHIGLLGADAVCERSSNGRTVTRVISSFSGLRGISICALFCVLSLGKGGAS